MEERDIDSSFISQNRKKKSVRELTRRSLKYSLLTAKGRSWDNHSNPETCKPINTAK